MADDDRQRLGRAEARDVILRAAARVFNREGRGITVEQIADEAGYSTSALYKHFQNKGDILTSLRRRVAEMTLEIFESEPPVELPFEGRLKWVLYQLVEFGERERALFEASMSTMAANVRADGVDPELLEMQKRIRAAFLMLMQVGIEDGTLREVDDPTLYVNALGGHLKVMSDQWALEGPFDFKARVDAAVELFLYGAATTTSPEDSR
jgi:AcrR family transcriptional regulator